MNERYYAFSEYCKKQFGRKLFRVALDAGMTCPNRDGTKGSRGCIFCSASGSGEFAIPYSGQPLAVKDLKFNHQGGKEGDFIAYFQSYTNTYAPLPQLRELFTSALEDPLFAGIDIATRPDCLDDEVLSLLTSLQACYPDKFIWVELGLQTIHESSAVYIRRGYETSVFDEACRKLSEVGLNVIVHVILGLPGEDKAMMLETIRHINTCPVSGIKIHLLHILEHTDLAEEYRLGKAVPLSFESYTDLVCDCIAVLRKDIVIHRLTGDGSRSELLAPKWSLDKKRVLNTIRHLLKEKDIVQGSCS